MDFTSSIIKISDAVQITVADNEAILINVNSGTYFGLDEVGTTIFKLISEHNRIELVIQLFLEEYDVSEEQLKKDITDFVKQLADVDMIEINEK